MTGMQDPYQNKKVFGGRPPEAFENRSWVYNYLTRPKPEVQNLVTMWSEDRDLQSATAPASYSYIISNVSEQGQKLRHQASSET